MTEMNLNFLSTTAQVTPLPETYTNGDGMLSLETPLQKHKEFSMHGFLVKKHFMLEGVTKTIHSL